MHPVCYTRKVRFSDTDCQNVVFNATYFVYFDDAITDYLEALGLPYAEIVRRGHDMVLARAECDFRSPATLGETLETAVGVERVGNTSLVFALAVKEAATGRLVAEGREVYVVLDAASKTSTPVPGYLRDAISALQGGRGE
ncbi:MAG: acyl-CoA thioesterase [Deltaproteobacteria bacterium]|nr:acyl-CoA thioesterase [Deltaproteobacteria bacterium]